MVDSLLFAQATGCLFTGIELWDDGPVVWPTPGLLFRHCPFFLYLVPTIYTHHYTKLNRTVTP